MLDASPKLVRATLLLACAAVALALLHGLLGLYFFGGRFLGVSAQGIRVGEVKVEAGPTVTAELLKEYLGIEEGTPLFNREAGLFSADLRRRLKSVLAAAPTLATLEATRHFDGHVEIRAVERTPLARIAGSGSPLAIDRNGIVFVCRQVDQLVSLEGVPVVALEPGRRIGGGGTTALAAIRLLERLAEGELPLPLSLVRSVSVGHVDYVAVFFKDGRSAKIAWQHMREPDESTGRPYLDAQVSGLAGAMQDPGSRGYRKFDAVTKGHCYCGN